MMELNAKSPFLWDWENLVMFNTPKKLKLTDSEIEGIEGFEIGSFFSSKSSKSASVDSSTYKDVRGTHFSHVNNDNNSSGISGESLIALELGKRTYFEDASGSSNVEDASRGDALSKKSKSSNLGSDSPCCQVQGCNLDLSYAKDYHKKHRVCESHSKSSKVVINGVERRFCQQCSRFHGLSEFDQKKRSCRRRLSDHNARRRKLKPEVIQFEPLRLTSSLFEGRNQLNLAFGQLPMLQNKHGTLDRSNHSKITLDKLGFSNTIKSGGTDELQRTHDGLHNPSTKASHVSTHLLPSKGPTSHVYQRDLPVSETPSNMAGAQDMRALSLLSTSSWGPSDSEQSILHPLALSGDPPTVPDFWNSQHQLANSGQTSQNSAFQLFKAPNESGFYLY